MSIRVKALPAALGATVEGLDANRLDENTVAELREAFWAHKVLFFPGIHLSDEQHVALGSIFGDLSAVSNDDTDHRRHETVDDEGKILVLDSSDQHSRANFWHTDVTFARNPPLGSLLSMKVSPPSGGDTMWANTQAAYEGLSSPIKATVENLTACHGRAGLDRFHRSPGGNDPPRHRKAGVVREPGLDIPPERAEQPGEQPPAEAAVRPHGTARIHRPVAMEHRRCLRYGTTAAPCTTP